VAAFAELSALAKHDINSTSKSVVIRTISLSTAMSLWVEKD